MIYAYRDKYHYLHGVKKDMMPSTTIYQFCSKYIEILDDIAEGGFIKININNKKYFIIDNGHSIMLLNSNKFYIPSQANMTIINSIYIKYTLDCLK